MTTAEHFPAEYYDDIRSDIDGPQPPQLHEVILSGPQQYIGVQDMRLVGHIEQFRQGIRQHYEVLLDDGSINAVTRTTPRNPKTDIWTVHKGAWLTSRGGHNEHTDLHMADNGFPMLFLSAKGEAAPGRALHQLGQVALHPFKTRQEIHDIELAAIAATMHGVLDVLPLFVQDDMQTKKIAVVGESEGAMSGFGMVAQAPAHGREVVTGQFVAPCYLDQITNREALRTIWHQLPAEVKALYEVGRHTRRRVLRHYLATISLNPITEIYQLANWPTLRSGQPREFINFIPSDQQMDVTTFAGDASGQPDEIKIAFRNHPNVRVHPRAGAHMSIAEPEMLDFTTSNLKDALLIPSQR